MTFSDPGTLKQPGQLYQRIRVLAFVSQDHPRAWFSGLVRITPLEKNAMETAGVHGSELHSGKLTKQWKFPHL